MKVLERPEVIVYLKKRQLEKSYLKAKEYLKNDQFKIVDFKIRQPKSDNIYYFRITPEI